MQAKPPKRQRSAAGVHDQAGVSRTTSTQPTAQVTANAAGTFGFTRTASSLTDKCTYAGRNACTSDAAPGKPFCEKHLCPGCGFQKSNRETACEGCIEDGVSIAAPTPEPKPICLYKGRKPCTIEAADGWQFCSKHLCPTCQHQKSVQESVCADCADETAAGAPPPYQPRPAATKPTQSSFKVDRSTMVPKWTRSQCAAGSPGHDSDADSDSSVEDFGFGEFADEPDACTSVRIAPPRTPTLLFCCSSPGLAAIASQLTRVTVGLLSRWETALVQTAATRARCRDHHDTSTFGAPAPNARPTTAVASRTGST